MALHAFPEGTPKGGTGTEKEGRCLQRKASAKLEGLHPSDFMRCEQFPTSRRISHQYPVVITPSEQVSEEVGPPSWQLPGFLSRLKEHAGLCHGHGCKGT